MRSDVSGMLRFSYNSNGASPVEKGIRCDIMRDDKTGFGEIYKPSRFDKIGHLEEPAIFGLTAARGV